MSNDSLQKAQRDLRLPGVPNGPRYQLDIRNGFNQGYFRIGDNPTGTLKSELLQTHNRHDWKALSRRIPVNDFLGRIEPGTESER